MYLLKPLFPGTSEIDQMFRICSVLGTPGSTSNVPIGGGEWSEGLVLAAKMRFKFSQVAPVGLESLFDGANISFESIELMRDLLRFDPHKRLNATQALSQPFFAEFGYAASTPASANGSLDNLASSRKAPSSSNEHLNGQRETELFPSPTRVSSPAAAKIGPTDKAVPPFIDAALPAFSLNPPLPSSHDNALGQHRNASTSSSQSQKSSKATKQKSFLEDDIADLIDELENQNVEEVAAAASLSGTSRGSRTSSLDTKSKGLSFLYNTDSSDASASETHAKSPKKSFIDFLSSTASKTRHKQSPTARQRTQPVIN
jgi:serine/threonine protein kinase